MVKDHHLQLKCHPPLFHNFRWFKIQVALGHHPTIQKEVVALLAKEAIEPFTHGPGF